MSATRSTGRSQSSSSRPSLKTFGRPEYLCFSDVRTFLNGQPVQDWLQRYGAAHGYRPSDDRSGGGPSTNSTSDFSSFIMQCGVDFESWVVESLIKPAVVQAAGPSAWADLSVYTRHQQNQHHQATLEALSLATTVIMFQPFFVDEKRGWYGHPDLVVRRDAMPWLEAVIQAHTQADRDALLRNATQLLPPHYYDSQQTAQSAQSGQQGSGWCIIDVKYSSSLTNKPLYQAQLWIYMLCLNAMEPERKEPVCVDDLLLLGRAGKLVRAFSKSSQMAQVETALLDAREWQKTVSMNEASEWKIVPVPSVRELMVSPTRDESSKWDAVLDEISAQQGDVCAVYKVGPAARLKLPFPTLKWWDPLCTAKYLGIRPDDQAQVNAMLEGARLVRNHQPVSMPAKLSWVDATGVPRATKHITIAFDFEFVYDLHHVQAFKDEAKGTQSWIFSVAAGVVQGDGVKTGWTDCVRTTTGELTDEGELSMMERWLTWMKAQQVDNSTVYAVHWSQAEVQAIRRLRMKVKGGTLLSDLLVWWDRCVVLIDAMNVMTTRKVVVPGAFEYGLKAVYSHMFRSPPVSIPPPPAPLLTKKRARKTPSTTPIQPPPKPLPTTTTRAGELCGTGLVGDQAAVVAYELAMQKRFTLDPDERLVRVLNYNMDDVRMTGAIWAALIQQ